MNRCVVRSAWFDPAGFTLLEVIVALALFSLILGMSGVAVASLREPAGTAATRHLIEARDSAIRSGHPVAVTVPTSEAGEYHAPRTTHYLFLPDGRGYGPDIDLLTGSAHASH
jgi:prepilin-type N-terminal cleavage/methylation domain-containing protein